MASNHATFAASLIAASGVRAPVTEAEFLLDFYQVLQRFPREHLADRRRSPQDPEEVERGIQEALVGVLGLLIAPVERIRRAALTVLPRILPAGVFPRLVTNLVALLAAKEPLRSRARASLVDLGPSALHPLISALRCGTDPIGQLAVCEVIAVIARNLDQVEKLSLLRDLRGGVRVTNDATNDAVRAVLV
jgi:hypothetical protein